MRAKPAPRIIETLGFHTRWGQRFLKLSHLGFLGFLSFLPGLDRMAGMFGFFGFMGIAMLCEMRVRFQFWPHLRRFSAILGITLAVALAGMVGVRYFRIAGSVAADVLVQQATVDHAAIDLMHDGNFNFADATRAAPATDDSKALRTDVRYEIINIDDDSFQIRSSAQSKSP